MGALPTSTRTMCFPSLMNPRIIFRARRFLKLRIHIAGGYFCSTFVPADVSGVEITRNNLLTFFTVFASGRQKPISCCCFK